MITAVDTNILLDILIPDALQGDISEKSLTESLGDGSVIISEAVYSELSAHFPTQKQLDRFLQETGISLYPSNTDALYLAGKTWREYLRRRANLVICPSCGTGQGFTCKKCGNAVLFRQHVIADFVIGAHAVIHADRLLTRDRGYYRTYFANLAVLQSDV